jgi:hypothetical protein
MFRKKNCRNIASGSGQYLSGNNTEAARKGFSSGTHYKLDLPQGQLWFELSIAPMERSEEHDLHYICPRDVTAVKLADEIVQK